MSMTFWDTVRGHHLADTLIRCLPKIANDDGQKVHRAPKTEVYDIIERLVNTGATIVSCVDNGSDEVLIITNK